MLPSTPAVTQNGNTLMSSAVSGNQWYLNGNIINGAVSQFYTASQNGFYSVKVTDGNNCSSSSPVINVTVIGITGTTLQNIILIYPNPAQDKLFIDAASLNTESFTVKIYNVLGEKTMEVKNEKSINISAFTSGLYFIQLLNEKGETVKMSRFVKE